MKYLKRKYTKKRPKRKIPVSSTFDVNVARKSAGTCLFTINSVSQVYGESDNFRLIKRCLSPMKKKTHLRAKIKSRPTSQTNSHSSSKRGSPKKPDTVNGSKLTKTEIFYKNEMMNEIRTYIYSTLRRKIMQKKFKQKIRTDSSRNSTATFTPKDASKLCSECGKPFKSVKKSNDKTLFTKLNPKNWFMKEKYTCYFCHNKVCKSCLAPEKAVIPTYVYFKGCIEPQNLCKRAFQFLKQFKYIKLSERTIRLIDNPRLNTF